MVNKFVDIDHRNYMGETSLSLAAAKGNIAICRFLVKKGADVKCNKTLIAAH